MFLSWYNDRTFNILENRFWFFETIPVFSQVRCRQGSERFVLGLHNNQFILLYKDILL